MSWKANPLIYEINTWTWLDELSRKYQRPVTLANIPTMEWDALADLGFAAVWLMGVWERSPAGRLIAMENQAMLAEFRALLPDYQPSDLLGSAYCVRRYTADRRLGGKRGLAACRQAMSERGLRLILDFVPNHLAPDHPWVSRHPEFFIQGSREDLANAPDEFIELSGHILARGRDPYFPPWRDVVQLNAFSAGMRRETIATLENIAAQCDGVRCDMAMMQTTGVLQRTWGDRAGAPLETDFWQEIIPALKASFPEFCFIGEVYWGMEAELIDQGFDYCYDKELYDRLVSGSCRSIYLHLEAADEYQAHMLRFSENHDERRAALAFGAERGKAAAAVILTLPGAKLLYHGQLAGRKLTTPVFLRRAPGEEDDEELHRFYERLLHTLRDERILEGEWRLCPPADDDSRTQEDPLLAWSWQRSERRYLLAINYAGIAYEGQIRTPWIDLADHAWQIHDFLSDEGLKRSGIDMNGEGIWVDLPPWGCLLITIIRDVD